MPTNEFDHSRMPVYRLSIRFAARADVLSEALPPGKAHLGDQLRRASSSVPINIAKGAGEFAAREKARFYRIARRSATECAGIVDLLEEMGVLDAAGGRAHREALLEIHSMLSRLVLTMVRGNRKVG